MTMRGIFISRKSCKSQENIVKSPKFISSFTFSKAIQWDRLEFSPGRFWALGPYVWHIWFIGCEHQTQAVKPLTWPDTIWSILKVFRFPEFMLKHVWFVTVLPTSSSEGEGWVTISSRLSPLAERMWLRTEASLMIFSHCSSADHWFMCIYAALLSHKRCMKK